MSPAPLHRRIFLHELQVSCSIGVHPREELAPQRVSIDVELLLDPGTEPQQDRLSATLDYEQVHDTVVRISRGRHYALQETLARALFDFCAALPGVIGVRIVTRKLDAYPDCTVGYELSSLPGQIF